MSEGQDGLPGIFVNTATLNLNIRAIDLEFGGSRPALMLERYYNLDSDQTGPFGNRWSFNLGERFTQEADKTYTLRRGSGRVDRFGVSLDSGRFFPISATADTLTRNADGTLSLASARSNTVRAFQADGRLWSVKDGALVRFTLEYDAAGRLATARYGGKTLSFAYGDDGHISSVTDSAGRTVQYVYDAQGNLTQQTGADGRTVTYQQDNFGIPVALSNAAGSWQFAVDSDALGIAKATLPDGTTRQYTAVQPRRVQVTNTNGDAFTYESSATGLTETITSPAGDQTVFTYDGSGRRTRVLLPGGDVLRFEYDSSGNLTGAVNAAGNRWSATCDAAGRVTRLADPRGSAWQFVYDSNGSPVSASDPSGATVSAKRTATGQVAAFTDGNGNQSVFEYNAGGLLSRWTDALGSSWTYAYDSAARPNSRTDAGGTIMQAQYDARNRMTAVTSGDNSLSFDFSGVERDAMGRVARSTDSFGNVVAYTYGEGGRLRQLTLPGGNQITYDYDRAGRLMKVSDWLGNFALYRYDTEGFVSSVSVSGGPLTVYQYDPSRQLKAIVSTGADGTPVAGYRYTYDAAGNRVALSALEPSPSGAQWRSVKFQLDAANRIVADEAQTYQYDAAGNLTAVAGARTASFAYDSFGRLTGLDAAASTRYGYDGLGLRVERRVNGDVRRFVYDLSGRPRPIMETDDAGNPVAYYVFGTGLLWKIAAGSGKTYFYHTDGNGNVAAVTDPAAGVVNRYRYDPLGRMLSATEGVENAFRARGESGWMDDGNGLLYGYGNFYMPDLGRTFWGSVDLRPPEPKILPTLSGALACLLKGTADCAFAYGREAR